MKSTYVVFGAYGGVGSALSRRLAKKGANLLLAGRDEARLADLAAEVGAQTFALDATNLRMVEACMKQASDLFGQVSGVANCVGSLLLKPAHLLFEEVRAATAAMTQHGGSIVLLSTAAARIGLANHEAISAAKAGVEGLALAAAASYASKGIRINCVAPGMTRTPLAAKLLQNEMMPKLQPACTR